MNLNTVDELILKVHDHVALTSSERKYVKDRLPRIIGGPRGINTVRQYSHPSGATIHGAPAGTFTQAHLIMLAKRAFGTKRMTGHPFYDSVEQRLTINVMRGYFEFGLPRGFYCCKYCSLAVFPLLKLDMLHYLPGKTLAPEMRSRIEKREGRFAKGLPDTLVDFVLSY